jgi:CheY-like chemotaxis protein
MAETKFSRTTLEIEPPAAGTTVLIVDDDQAIRDGVGEFLREEGFVVVTAANGAEALAHLRGGLSADVILLDLMMPIIDGWDFRAEQLADPSLQDIPVVAISASGFARSTIGAQLKAHDVFAKPIELSRLVETLKDVCGLRESGQGSSTAGG